MNWLRGLAPLALLLSGCERGMIYFPQTASLAQLAETAARLQLEPWRDGDGHLQGWRPRARSGKRAVVVFHGNAGHALQRMYLADGFDRLNEPRPRDVHLFEYPGYGAREGKPSERAIQTAAVAALASLRQEGYTSIALVGESLGSGVASYVAGQEPQAVHGLLLITPFTSLRDVAAEHYPGWLVSLLLRERYDNVAALGRYRGPVGVLVAARDEVVPASLGERLFAQYGGLKRLWVQPDRTHNTVDYAPNAGWWRELVVLWDSTAPR